MLKSFVVSFQMQCKLYVFEKTAQSWIERGRGLLRLNDMASTDDGTLQSRLGKHTCPVAASDRPSKVNKERRLEVEESGGVSISRFTDNIKNVIFAFDSSSY